MELRYLLAVVTGAGSGRGREVAVALSRAGCAVLCVDADLGAAERAADDVRRGRVAAWALAADLADDLDARLVAARARDLGGADLLVTGPGAAADLLAELVVVDALQRPGRRPGTPATARLGAGTSSAHDVVRRLAQGDRGSTG